MSVVLSAIFPDFGMLISDSRISNGDGSIRRDELQKIFALGEHLAVGFTSNDVSISYLIIKSLTEYSRKKARSQNALYLIPKLQKVANFEYKKITKSKKIPPAMNFTYVGMVGDKASLVPSDSIFKAIQDSGGSISPEIGQILLNSRNGLLTFPPPIFMGSVQDFPDNTITNFNTFGLSVRGSGSGVFKEIEPEINKILLTSHKTMRIAMLQISIQDFCIKNNIPSVGGLNQIVIIDKNGVYPQGYTNNIQTKEDGTIFAGKKMEYRQDGWYQVDIESGKEIRVGHYHPLNIQDGNNEFQAYKGLVA